MNANTVLAAERVGDAQMQARDLLSGTVGGQTKAIDRSPAMSADGHQYPDPQEQARQFILGRPSFGGTAPAPVSGRQNSRTHADPQELARRMILGTGVSDTASAGVRLSGIGKVRK